METYSGKKEIANMMIKIHLVILIFILSTVFKNRR